jgi:ADP-ribosylglycohydrolase
VLGAIAGDIIGSAYEWQRTKSYSFELFTPASTPTDDTVLTVAVADCILHGKDYATTLREYGHRHPHAGWGGMFFAWLFSSDPAPYNSFGNGSAMRVSPVGFAFDTLDEVLAEAERSAEVSHNHPEGIKGAQAVASCILLARQGRSKGEIKDFVEARFGYDLNRTLDEIRPSYRFYETCQQSVPEAIVAFLESTHYEDAVRKAVSLGGDADTLACMTGGIAQAYYRTIPALIIEQARARLPDDFMAIIDEFEARFATESSHQ